jgi:hypothetical protein
MTYKSYGTKATTPSRMARKRMRRDVFIGNKKMAKALRKAARLERKSLAQEQGEE